MKFYDLFSGVGGFHKGLEQAGGFECAGACEIDEAARRVYAHHWPDVRLDHDAVKLERLPRGTDILCAGFPCQPFSLAGRRLGLKDERGGMFAEIIRLAADGRVPYILLENVPGLLSNDSNLTFATILRSLDACGYDVQWLSINGLGAVPQTRDRVFIAAHLRGERAPEILSLAEGDRWDPAARSSARKIQSASALTTGCGHFAAANQNIIAEERMLPPSLLDPDDHSMAMTATYSKGVGNDRPFMLIPLNPGVADAQRIYDAAGPSRTLKAESGGQGGKTGLYTIPAEIPPIKEVGLLFERYHVRRLTPLECERLMGYPDGWSIPAGSDNARYRCLGNAVIPQVIEQIGRRFPN